MVNKLMPSIRFAGFTDAWEQCKLGEHSQILAGGTPKTQIKEYWEPKEIPWMSSGEINKKRLFSTDNQISKLGFENSSARWVKESSVLIALAGQGKTRGTVAINEIPLTTNQSIAAIEPDDKLDSEFLFQNLEKRYEELRLASSGDGSRGGLNKQIISDLKIIAPSVKEQTKIGSFFKQLDNTIALHQRELDLLKEQKKGFLQKTFPKKDENVPEIRFKGFTDAWEERKLGDYVIIRSGWSPSNFDINNNANNLFIKVDDLNYSTRVQEESQVKVNILSKYKKMKKSSTIFPKRGAAIMINKVRMLGEDSYMDTNMMALEPKGIDPEYLYTFINKTGLYKIADTSTIPQINNKHIEPYLLLIPSLEEQHKIGSFFKQLDGTIALHQRKLDLLKELKKGYLQKMFV